MRPDLLDAEAAINWAVAQLPTLEERIIAWQRDKPYTVWIDADSEPGKKVYRFRDIKPLDPIINAEAGAIIHSIRSSLDLLACALAVRNNRSPGSTYFPIWKSEAEFLVPQGRNAKGNTTNPTLEKIERLSQVSQAIIKSLKPYPRGNDLLVALHNLDLTRKHRRLLNAFIFRKGVGFHPGFKGRITMGDWRDFNEEAEILTSTAEEPDNELSIRLQVAINETGPMHGKNFTATIRDFARMAQDILVLFCRPGT